MQTGCAESVFPAGQGGDFFFSIGGLAVDAAGLRPTTARNTLSWEREEAIQLQER